MIDRDELAARRARLSPAKQALLEQRLRGAKPSESAQSHIPERPLDEPARLSFSQQRLWFLDRLEPGNPAYNIPVAYRLRGALDVAALEASLRAIAERHQILQATFSSLDGEPRMDFDKAWPFSLDLVDLGDAPGNQREAQARRLASREAQQSFDLSQGPLFRARLLRLDRALHVLVCVLHHIVADGWSVEVLARELSSLYAALSAGEPSPLAELPVQFPDYAHWQREWFWGVKLEAFYDYWKRQLRDLPGLGLPTDWPRPPVQTYRGAHCSLMLPRELVVALDELGRTQGATPFMTLLAAFQVLLYRYSGQKDLAVGTPVAGRYHPQVEDLIGCFTNNLVLRADLSGKPTFRELLGRVREMTLGAYANQELPFERVVEALGPERDLSTTPLFQVLFNLRNVRAQGLALADLEVEAFEFEPGIAALDLNVELVEGPQGISCTFGYNSDLFAQTTIERMLAHYRYLLEGVVYNPEACIADLPLMTTAEERRLLVTWNDTRASYPGDQTLVSLFEAQAGRTPGAAAFVFEGQSLSYDELNRRANQVAHTLRSLGVGPEVIVGLCLERSLETVIALLGILKAGGAYLPLDPLDPRQRLVFMLVDARAQVLLTLAEFAPLFFESDVEVLYLDADRERITTQPETNPLCQVRAENLAYVLYTSGSTGEPKGVLGLHRGALNRFAWMWRAYPFETGEVSCQKTALGFVDSIWELFGPLLQGVPSVIIPQEVVGDPQGLVRVLVEQRVTRIVLVPSLLKALLDSHPDLHDLVPDLKSWMTSGEALPLKLCQRFQHALPGCVLLNLYGSTEVTADVTCYETGALPGDLFRVPIGRPIANTQVYILDPDLRPLPVGVPGELCVGGAGLARGYLGRPALTAEKFIPDPFSRESGARLYRTGDLARFLPDGNIEFLGRLDSQVKVRGYRVEPGEIEATLRQHPGLRGAALLARQEAPDMQRLVAYLVPEQGRAPAIDELRRYLGERLPAYMIPSTFVSLDEFPLTSSGKLDYRALPAPGRKRPGLREAFLDPRDVLELELVRIWEGVLEVQPIGLRDNFFDLGGHSLLAVRLFAEVEKATGRSLPLATLFQAPTVEGLAERLRQEGWRPPWRSLVAIQPEGEHPPFFCIHALGGNVLTYAGLSRHLGPEQPFYGLQAVGLDEREEPFTRVEEMAAHYVGEICTVQPEGPYYLGGFCFGGIVAFEMAQQFQTLGERVVLLVLVDTPFMAELVLSEVSFLKRAKVHVNRVAKLPPEERPVYLKALARDLVKGAREGLRRIRRWDTVQKRLERLEERHDRLLRTLYQGYPALGLKIPTGSGHIWNLNQLAQRAYVPRRYPGQVVLFQNERYEQARLRSQLGWEKLATGGVEIIGVPGDHMQIVREPYVGELAAKLGACLRRAQEEFANRRGRYTGGLGNSDTVAKPYSSV